MKVTTAGIVRARYQKVTMSTSVWLIQPFTCSKHRFDD